MTIRITQPNLLPQGQFLRAMPVTRQCVKPTTRTMDGATYRLLSEAELKWLQDVAEHPLTFAPDTQCYSVPVHIVQLEDGFWIKGNGLN